ncbi:hypothetical protein C5167_007327 [Papaver somniferum]|nr:hypothetical protein C5167_007327 [Papaver somniferum]
MFEPCRNSQQLTIPHMLPACVQGKKQGDINTADAKKSSEMFAAKGIKERVLMEAEKNKARVVKEVEGIACIMAELEKLCQN